MHHSILLRIFHECCRILLWTFDKRFLAIKGLGDVSSSRHGSTPLTHSSHSIVEISSENLFAKINGVNQWNIHTMNSTHVQRRQTEATPSNFAHFYSKPWQKSAAISIAQTCLNSLKFKPTLIPRNKASTCKNGLKIYCHKKTTIYKPLHLLVHELIEVVGKVAEFELDKERFGLGLLVRFQKVKMSAGTSTMLSNPWSKKGGKKAKMSKW